MDTQVAERMAYDARTDEHEFASFVERTTGSPCGVSDLIPLLHGGHAIYSGRGSNQVARMKGYLIASFKDRGPPEGAFTYVLELLENSQTPYLVAAAAQAVRNITEPTDELVAYLRIAISNIQYRDEPISFECYAPEWPRDQFTSALEEIVTTLAEFADRSPSARSVLKSVCESDVFRSQIKRQAAEALRATQLLRSVKPVSCYSKASATMPLAPRQIDGASKTNQLSLPQNVWFEDQNGRRASFEEAFIGKPTVIAFFYTRCGNPNKCSMTVSKLAELRKVLKVQGIHQAVNVAAVTYDPRYDTPDRLRSYCQCRGFVFDDTMRAWRADPERFEEIRSFFDLGVSYASSVVSRHEIEVYVLDRKGFPVTAFTKLQFDVDDLAVAVTALV